LFLKIDNSDKSIYAKVKANKKEHKPIKYCDKKGKCVEKLHAIFVNAFSKAISAGAAIAERNMNLFI
jgi:hypothetical protein